MSDTAEHDPDEDFVPVNSGRDDVVVKTARNGFALESAKAEPLKPMFAFFAPFAPDSSQLKGKINEIKFINTPETSEYIEEEGGGSYASAITDAVTNYAKEKIVPIVVTVHESDRKFLPLIESVDIFERVKTPEGIQQKINSSRQTALTALLAEKFLASSVHGVSLKTIPPKNDPDTLAKIGEQDKVRWVRVFVNKDNLGIAIAAIEATFRNPVLLEDMKRLHPKPSKTRHNGAAKQSGLKQPSKRASRPKNRKPSVAQTVNTSPALT